MAGWGEFFGGIGKILDKIPIQGRRERWRNEIDKLEKEKNDILIHKAEEKKSLRLQFIIERIDYLNGLLKNAEKE